MERRELPDPTLRPRSAAQHVGERETDGHRVAPALQRSGPLASIAALQRLAGNRAVSALVSNGRSARDDGGRGPARPAPVQREGTTPTATADAPVTDAARPTTAPVSASAPGAPMPAPAAPGSVYKLTTPERSLMVEAGGTWKKVKGKYLGSGGSNEAMKRIVDYRKTYVDGLLEKMKSTHGVGARAVGSTALSSDYDVTFLGPMAAAAAAVVQFNREFGEDWKSESGTVFDTNVYAEDFLGGKPAGAVREDDPTKMTATGAVDDAVIQDANALVKARKNMSKPSWAMFVNRVVFALPLTQQAHARKQFDTADATYRTTYVGSLIARLSPEKVATMRRAGKSDPQIVEELETGAEGVEAANREYEAQLLSVGELEQERDALATASHGPPTRERWTELTLEIRKAKSKAMLFANEPYFSAGTLYHVVGNMQGAWGVKLGVPEYFQSANENFGDFKKEIGHHGGGDATGVEFRHFAVASSKYAYRFFDAATKLKQSGIEIDQPVESLRDSEGRLLAIRQGEALGLDAKRIDERAIGAARDDAGKLRLKDATGKATGTEVATGTDYREAAVADKDEDARTYVAEMGVSSISELDRKLTNVSIEVNVAARKAGQERST